MKEYISRDELMDSRQKAVWVYENAHIINTKEIRDGLRPLLDKIVDVSAVKDLTEVVRCKSCRFSKWSDKNQQRYCQRKWAMYKVKERDYCSYGIRIKNT